MNGLSLVVLPSSRNRTRSEFAAADFMYSTILSHRASLLSVPILKPRNCSGVCSVPAAVVASVDMNTTAAAWSTVRRVSMKPPTDKKAPVDEFHHKGRKGHQGKSDQGDYLCVLRVLCG